MGNVLIEETSLDSVGDAIREQLDVSTKYKVSEMPDAIRSISGGGGGTTNYNNLSNKPQINSVTLEGNKSLSDLSIQETLTFDSTPTDGSTNPVTSDGIYDAFAGVDTALSGKVDTTSVGVANGIAELDNDGLVPSSQLPDVAYTDVTNKPSINSVTLSGNKTTADLGLVNNTDLTDIIATGPTNATGNTITSGLYFYLDGVLCKAKSDIASGATFTLNTNYEVVTAGGLNSLNSALTNCIKYEDKVINTGTTGWFDAQFTSGKVPLEVFVGGGYYAFLRGYNSTTNTYTYQMCSYDVSTGVFAAAVNRSNITVHFIIIDL